MSLLIDALKKHRLTSTPSVAQVGGDALKSTSVGRTKKIILISLITVIVISLTATVSFLIFKHIEKKRITQTLHDKIKQVQKKSDHNIKGLLEEKLSEVEKKPSATEDAGELREKLMERMQQRKENPAPAAAVATTSSSNDSSVASDASSSTNAPAAATDTTSSAAPAASDETPRARLAARRAGGAVANTQNDNNNAQTNGVTSDDASSSSDDNSQDNTDTSSESSDSSSDNNSSNNGVKVDIQAIPDELGANNPTYQKALGFMQANQYDKALSLLANNDELLLKTQGLSALLLARIYLTTGEYELADQVLDRALLLHAGSEMDLLGLRAQALFMQKKYQEAIDLLSSQSPDLTTSPGYYALLADAYMHLDQASNAVSVFQQIVARFPNSPEYWLGLAVAYQKTGDASSAMVAYRRAAQLSPDDPQVTLFINQQLQALQTT